MDPAILLTEVYAELMADAKHAEALEEADKRYAALADIDIEKDPNAEFINGIRTARAYGQMEGIAKGIEKLTGKKFKFVNPKIRDNGKTLVAVNVLGWALYRGFISGEPMYYILKPGDKAMSLEPVKPDFPGWVFIDPDQRRKNNG